MSGNDSYSSSTQTSPTLTEKLSALRGFVGRHKSVLLTTRSPNGQLHSRVMAPAEITRDWRFRFLYDNESYKEKEVENECVGRDFKRE
jgi:general stress protein 26